MKKVEMTGKVFHHFTVLREDSKTNDGRIKWLCRCVCGKEKSVSGTELRNGGTKSCGCLASEIVINRNLRHGKSKTTEHTIWKGIIQRCTNKNNPAYKYYGGRGIKISDEWLSSFETFLKDMGNQPSSTHSIDRKDNNGNYCKENCYWATKKEQSANKRNNRLIEHEGKIMILQDWANHLQIPVSTLHSSLKVKTFKEAYEYYRKSA